MTERYFEDFAVGERLTTRGVTMTESMILDFALVHDPQPFHIDVEAARQSNYGGLIASGFQTLALSFRMLWDSGCLTASMGSPGWDELRWLKPVRAGDTIHVEIEVLEKQPSRSKPDRGVMRVIFRSFNQHGEEVLSARPIVLLRRRPAQEEASAQR
ncbi:MAG TPA: MaoC family dehydratase [Stellaceae bacterium]|nr:MaoC family dehydratase [Stellaceae bacterium]